MRKVFYDKQRNKEIVDVSGKKTLKKIIKDFGEGSYQEACFNETVEGYHFIDGEIQIFSLAEKQQQLLQEQETQRALLIEKKEALKIKLNLSDEDFLDLEKIIKGGL